MVGLSIVSDCWLLNKQTQIDAYPIPYVDELLDRLAKARYFTKRDLVSGYHQVKVGERHKF